MGSAREKGRACLEQVFSFWFQVWGAAASPKMLITRGRWSPFRKCRGHYYPGGMSEDQPLAPSPPCSGPSLGFQKEEVP